MNNTASNFFIWVIFICMGVVCYFGLVSDKGAVMAEKAALQARYDSLAKVNKRLSAEIEFRQGVIDSLIIERGEKLHIIRSGSAIIWID